MARGTGGSQVSAVVVRCFRGENGVGRAHSGRKASRAYVDAIMRACRALEVAEGRMRGSGQS